MQPLRRAGADDALYMLVQDVGGIEPDSERQLADAAADAETAAQQIEMELRANRERLQTTTEELESSNEELRSANEELSSMNEELQSANEELETSKEELQSINEELQTANAELNSRVEELSRAYNDINNLLENTQIATIFLDRDLVVRSFTPAAKDLFRLVESDAGRPITHVRARFTVDTIQEDAEKVLRTVGTIERHVQSAEDDELYIMRMLPYRTVDDVIGGVVITFTDITRISAAEVRIDELTRDLRNRLESLETLLHLVPVGIFIVKDGQSQQIRVNRYGARLLREEGEREGLQQVSARYQLLQDGRELALEDQPLQRAARLGEAVPGVEAQMVRADGRTWSC